MIDDIALAIHQAGLRDAFEKGKAMTFEDDPLHAALDAQIAELTRKKIALRGALSKAVAHCDAATHPDQQYADDRPNLLRALEETQ